MTSAIMTSEVKAKKFSPFSVDSLLSHREKVINNNAATANGIPRAVVLPQKQEEEEEAGEDKADRDENSDFKSEVQSTRGKRKVSKR